MDDLRVTLVQAETVWHEAEANRALYGDLARGAGATDLVVFPETFTSGFSNEAAANAERADAVTLPWMRALAAEIGAAVTGSVAVREGGTAYNRLYFAWPDGRHAHYDKRHLFRMAREHERYGAGRDRIVVELRGWRICPLVCYDLRFPVFSRNRWIDAAECMDYDLMLNVANWPAARRTAWRTLLRAWAIENLCYAVGVNRVGEDGNGIAYAGDSAAVDFLGESLVDFGTAPQVATVRLSASRLAQHRERFPAHLDADAFALLPQG